MSDLAANPPPEPTVVPCSLRALLGYFLQLGTLGFGGPIALAGAMQRDLVEARRWISQEDYRQGLALAQLAPGPLAAQLAIYLGWVRGGVWGATAVGLAFVLPSFFMVLVLAALYVRFGGLAWMQGAFYGIGAAVIAIIGRSVYKLAKLTLAKDRLLWPIAVASGLVTAWTERESLWLFLAAGLTVMAARTGRRGTAMALLPLWSVTGVRGPADVHGLGELLAYFTQAGAFVFGSGLAIVPFLHGGAVVEYKWLTEQQFLDAVAVAMITPGPVVITCAFVGWLAAGPVGALLAAIGVFLPCWAFVVGPAPWFRKHAAHPQLHAFVGGVTAAATGAIGGAAWVLGRRALVDVPTVAIAGLTLLALLKLRKAPEPLLILVAGAAGMLLRRLA